MGREGNFQASALKYLNDLPGCKAENVSGNSHQSGRPDITGCFQGRMFKLELKSPDNRYKASQKQNLELRKWRKAGCVTGVIYSMEALRQLFEKTYWEHGTKQVHYIMEDNNCCSWFDVPPVRY